MKFKKTALRLYKKELPTFRTRSRRRRRLELMKYLEGRRRRSSLDKEEPIYVCVSLSVNKVVKQSIFYHLYVASSGKA